MAPEKKPRKCIKLADRELPPVVGAFSIPGFCKAHGDMSVAMFHKLQEAGEGPAVMHVGKRTMISAESAAAWRREREAETMARRREQAAAETAATA